ncbi:hypothetical protein ABG067_003321 [Albugo candida]
MGPKKLSVSSLNEKRNASVQERIPLPVRDVPALETVLSHYTPPSKPKELFSEWNTSFASEHWCSESTPYVDPTPLEAFLCMQANPTHIKSLFDVESLLFAVNARDQSAPKITSDGPSHQKAVDAPILIDPETMQRSQELDSRFFFQRKWTCEQLEQLKAWEINETRVRREREAQSRAWLAYEDTLACHLANRTPHFFTDEIEIDPNDLIDDEDDTTHTFDVLQPPPSAVSLINTLCKPRFPEGSLIQCDTASVFRVIQQLLKKWQCQPFQFPWESIYPQDLRGAPLYNAGARYSIRLYVLGRWRSIDVDDRLPVDEEGRSIYLSTMHPSDLWPSLLCKAISKTFYWLRESLSLQDEAIHIGHLITCLTSWKLVPFSGSLNSFFDAEKLIACPEALEEPDILPAVLICGREGDSKNLRPREIALVEELVQDEVSLIGFYDQYSEFVRIEDTNMSAFYLFLMYPPAKAVAEMMHTWTEAPTVNDNTASVIHSSPPNFISTRLLVLKHCQKPKSHTIDLVLTLSRVPPVEIHAADLSEVSSKALGVAKDASLFLIEQDVYRQRPSSNFITVDTTRSVRLSLDHNVDHIFRISPLSNLVYGFALQSEAFSKHQEPPEMKIMEIADFWKEEGLNTIKTRGTTGVLRQSSWTILMMQVIKIQNSSEEPVWLWTNLDLSDGSIAPNVSLSVVDNNTCTVITRCPLLYDRIKLCEGEDRAVVGPFTILLECHAPDQLDVIPITWELSIATNCEFTSSQVHDPLSRVEFAGPYTPNRSMVLFRDTLSVSKSTTLTSVQAQLMTDDETVSIVNDLAVRFDIFESGSGHLLSSLSAIGPKALQLPWQFGQSEGCSSLTVVASIDEILGPVPEDLQARVAFHSSFSTPLAGEEPKARTNSQGIYWHLTCFSTENVRFEPDVSREREFESIVEGWQQCGKHRDANGAISRLFFLREPELSELKSRQENVSEDTLLKTQRRLIPVKGEGNYIHQIASSNPIQRIKLPNEIEQEEEEILQTMKMDEVAWTERQAARIGTKQTYTDQVSELWSQIHIRRAQLSEQWESFQNVN